MIAKCLKSTKHSIMPRAIFLPASGKLKYKTGSQNHFPTMATTLLFQFKFTIKDCLFKATRNMKAIQSFSKSRLLSSKIR